MIINNINGGDMTWVQHGSGTSQTLQGELRGGQYTAPFEPVGAAPFKVELKVSNGFTTEVDSPETLVSFNNTGSSTKPLNTPTEVK